jgi:hypothetical protein
MPCDLNVKHMDWNSKKKKEKVLVSNYTNDLSSLIYGPYIPSLNILFTPLKHSKSN